MMKKPNLAGALWPIFMEMIGDEQTKHDLGKCEFDPELYRLSCVRGDLNSIRTFSINLKNNLSELRNDHNQRQEGSERKGFYAPLIFGDLAYRMLQKCQEHSIPPPQELCQFFGAIFYIEGRGKSKKRKPYERELAAYILANNPKINKTQLCIDLGISRDTIFTWLKDAKFNEQIEAMEKVLRPASK